MNPWAELWQKTSGFDRIMDIVMTQFADNLNQKFNLSKDDDLLDIGCGPGALEKQLKDNVNSIIGVDISDRYVNECKIKFTNTNCNFYQIDPNNYLNFSMFSGHTFSKVIVMSVIQYFSSVDEVKILIESMRPLIKKGGKMIIADIIVVDDKFSDLYDLMVYTLKKLYLFSFVKFVLYAKFSSYSKIRKEANLLIISQDKLEELADDLPEKTEFIDRITIHKRRKNLIIHF